jgi:hypothetical protein
LIPGTITKITKEIKIEVENNTTLDLLFMIDKVIETEEKDAGKGKEKEKEKEKEMERERNGRRRRSKGKRNPNTQEKRLILSVSSCPNKYMCQILACVEFELMSRPMLF